MLLQGRWGEEYLNSSIYCLSTITVEFPVQSFPHILSDSNLALIFYLFKLPSLPSRLSTAHSLPSQPVCVCCSDLLSTSPPISFIFFLQRTTKMHSKSMFAVLATMGLVAATPVDYTLQGRGSKLSKPGDINCPGEIIGYRTVMTKDIADTVNTAKTFPQAKPHGKDLGNGVIYFSDGFGDWAGDGTETHWCVAYADTTQLKAANKVWFTEDPKLKQCTRFSDSNVNAYISIMSNDKFSPASTLRFAKLEHYLQVAIPFAMLDKMKVCGKCYPRPEAETLKSDYPRVNWKKGPWVGSNVRQKRDDLDGRAPAACPVKAKPTPSPKPIKSKPKTSKPKTTKPKTTKPKTTKPKGLKARTA
ncbi:hypothetical protein C7974DRAFT_384909 [Boeremia exigua]|uniref:uncharacterized protein n=1 Tax=Boeremia exigua TaxID=749465 RepID=UPI001E8D4779|nr:uncharacterized protein C7974DRAFT_384909 [Boeremia exigua]KAH6642137.1 hypothetical protein C7974DRAFT_384909 [Boeremia exigua]